MPSSHTPRTCEELGAIEAQREQRQLRASQAHKASELSSKESDILRQEELEKARTYTDTPFTPPPALASQILRDFLADVSLGSIASIANTSFEQLSLWLDSPEVTHRLAAMQRTLQRKLHTRALNQTEGFLCAIDRSLTQFNELESYLDPTSSPADTKNSLRNRENITKSGHLMLRLVQTLALSPSAQAPTHPPRQRHRRKRPALPPTTPAPKPTDRAEEAPTELPASPAPPAPQVSPLSDLKSQICNPAPPAPTSLPAHSPPAPSTSPPPVSNLKFQICNSASPPPAPTAHPGAMRYPAGPTLKPDPLPATHPAILSGAVASSLDASCLDASVPSSLTPLTLSLPNPKSPIPNPTSPRPP